MLVDVAERLRSATGLLIEAVQSDRALRVPALRQELFDWTVTDERITVHGFLPAHPYLWENLDAVLTAAGCTRDGAAYAWQPNPEHARLRTRWDSLSRRDRFVLTLPAILGSRPFDGLLRH